MHTSLIYPTELLLSFGAILCTGGSESDVLLMHKETRGQGGAGVMKQTEL